jgi:hypothetical protein
VREGIGAGGTRMSLTRDAGYEGDLVEEVGSKKNMR